MKEKQPIQQYNLVQIHTKSSFLQKKKKNPTQNIPLTTTAKLENMSSDTKYFLDTSNC